MLFHGALVRKNYPDNQPVPSSVPSILTWDLEDYDTDEFHSIGSSRFTIPINVSKIRVLAQLVWKQNATGLRQLCIKKNGTFFPGDPCANTLAVGETTTDIVAVSPVLQVQMGDYFEAEAYQNSGVFLDVLASTGTWFAIEVIE